MTSEIIRNLIKNQTVPLFLESNSKDDILNEIAENISLSKKNHDKLEILNGLKEREAKASTGTDYGVAIPHTSISKINDSELFLFLSKKGVPFDSFDFIPSKIFFVILSPKFPKKPKISNLIIMANICRTMRIETIRTRITLANNLQEILKSLENQ
jgi:mannitol/fructose-specific phosphotransferase system IIA component (Ntr-type)